tara:strand:- start:179 stop:541 length:363 start_codon:yes stop_codon:yes gene_type:complete
MIYLIGILFGILLYLVFYYLGRFLCNKINSINKQANKNIAIILSVILIPLVMTTDQEVLAYGIGYGISPFLATVISHFLSSKFFNQKKTRKKESFFNKVYYQGFIGVLILSYLGLLLPAN